MGSWHHDREFSPLDEQTVIRQNRDTLDSSLIADISNGATLTVPDAGDRYLSVMVVNQDHYINRVIHETGDHELTMDEFDTPLVVLVARILVDPTDPADVAAVHELQDQFALHAGSQAPFVMPDYEETSFTATRQALLELARGLSGFDHAFGSKANVDPVRHLIGTAAGWGGLPEQEAFYINVEPKLPVGEYSLNVKDVRSTRSGRSRCTTPKDSSNPTTVTSNSINSATAQPNDDGSITVNFGGCSDDRPNCVPIMDGWNYVVRLYQPHPEILNGTWSFPTAHAR